MQAEKESGKDVLTGHAPKLSLIMACADSPKANVLSACVQSLKHQGVVRLPPGWEKGLPRTWERDLATSSGWMSPYCISSKVNGEALHTKTLPSLIG